MSENKRFTNNGIEILQYGNFWAVAYSPHHAEVIAEALNILIKENDQLKQENIHLEDDLRYYKTKSASCEQGLIQYEHELNTYKRKLEEILRKWYANANKLRTPIRKLDYGEDIDYWNGIKQFIEELSDKLGVDLE